MLTKGANAFEVERGYLASFLIGPRKKAGLVFEVLARRGHRFLSGIASFQLVFLDSFHHSLFRTLIHEQIIA